MSFRPIFKGYVVTFKKDAKKDLDSLPKEIAKHINEKLDDLVSGKDGLDIKKLSGYAALTYRLRVNSYRVIFEPYKHKLIVFVVNVFHRQKDEY